MKLSKYTLFQTIFSDNIHKSRINVYVHFFNLLFLLLLLLLLLLFELLLLKLFVLKRYIWAYPGDFNFLFLDVIFLNKPAQLVNQFRVIAQNALKF